MKLARLVVAGAFCTLAVTTVSADTVLHLAGSGGYRKAAVVAIQNLMGGAGNYKAAFAGTTGSITDAQQCIFQGNIAGLPSGANPVTIKCSWNGGVGGLESIRNARSLYSFMSITNLPGTNTTVGVATPSYAVDSGTFSGETSVADASLTECKQADVGYSPYPSLTQTKVGVLPFEWVGGSSMPSGATNITLRLAQAASYGGMPVSQLTLSASDLTPVYLVGGNFTSGTRVAELAESHVGIFGSVSHVKATLNGAGTTVISIGLWPAETIMGVAYPIGWSGYWSDAAVADALTATGSTTADTVTSIPPNEQVLFGPGHLLGCLPRNEAVRACRTVSGTPAHRLAWNGVKDWTGTAASDGSVTYNDDVIKYGLYTMWEYVYMSYSPYLATNPMAVADAIGNRIKNYDAPQSGIKLSDMYVVKQVAGGVVTY